MNANHSPPELPEGHLSATDLTGLANPVEDSFLRQVYDRQVAISTERGLSPAAGIRDRELEPLPTSVVQPGRTVSVRCDILGDLTGMMTDARTALASAQHRGTPESTSVTELRVLSGYRSAREQLSIWEREYAKYYRDTRVARRDLPGGEHGSDAVDYLAHYINRRVFSPGYSPHQQGGTVDLTYRQSGRWSAADTNPTAIGRWRESWFFAWLCANAARYGFAQNPDLDEPWHWEHRR